MYVTRHVCVHVVEVYFHMHVWRLGINIEYHPLSIFTLHFETSLSLNLGLMERLEQLVREPLGSSASSPPELSYKLYPTLHGC